jgi:hypothetical protein
MSKKYNQILTEDRSSQLILISLTIISAFLAFLFWRNPLTVYDAAGHVSLVQTIASDFWPKMSGWNSTELLGWPQGVFYPSLFHWLAAGISFLTGVSTAIKLLISAALVVLPASIYYFAMAFTQDKRWAAIITVVLFALILVFPNFLGTGVRALFQIGLLSNFFVLPFLFFFLTSLHKERDFLLSALLLSVVVLTHLVAAMVAGVYLGLFLVNKYLIGKLTRRLLVNYLEMLILVAALTAFFWIPFVLNLEYTSVSRHVSSYFLPNVAVLIISISLIVYSWREKDLNVLTLSKAALFITFLAVIDAFLIRNNGTSFVLYPFHIYRFQPFAYLLLTAAIIITVSKYIKFDRWGFTSLGVLFGALGLIVVLVLAKNPVKLPDARFELKNADVVKGRFLETFRRTESDPFWYGLQTKLNRENQNAAWTYGLFTDSTPNGPYFGSLIRSLRPEAYSEGDGIFIETKTVDQIRITPLLDLFAVNYLINLDYGKEKAIGTFRKGKEKKFYVAEKSADIPIFEVARLPLEPIDKNWEKQVENWWFEAGSIEKLPYLVTDKKLAEAAQKELEKAKAEIVKTNENQTYFELKIDSEKPVPVLAKISYFPYWKAFQNGEEIPIYHAAPSLMVFEAKGEVELVYKEPTVNRIALFISLISWVVILGFLVRRLVKRTI